MKVALYARVSTEDQAKYGISIDAQTAALRNWASANGHEIIGEYIDEGVSGRISPSKRPELRRLVNDIPEKKTELIAFCKLDRWTRNVKGYYQVQDILDRFGVAWTAIQEDYETITASGRMKVNIMLSVAENEADRTGERIKAVYEHKVALGQPINGSLPLGLKIDGKSIAVTEDAEAVIAAFNCYADTGNKNAVQKTLDDFGHHLSFQSIGRLLRNKLYIGEYRNNASYCEPIIDRELFYRVQRDLTSRSSRTATSGRLYLFSGLIVCGECGRKLSGIHPNVNKHSYYHCHTGHCNYKDCSNKTYFREDIIETAVVDALAEIVKGKAKEVASKKKKPSNKAAVERKLARLRELYVDGDISKEQYRLRRDELAATIKPQEETRPKIIVGDNFKADYNAMTDEQKKKKLLRAVVDKVVAHASGEIDVFLADLSCNRKLSDEDLL